MRTVLPVCFTPEPSHLQSWACLDAGRGRRKGPAGGGPPLWRTQVVCHPHVGLLTTFAPHDRPSGSYIAGLWKLQMRAPGLMNGGEGHSPDQGSQYWQRPTLVRGKNRYLGKQVGHVREAGVAPPTAPPGRPTTPPAAPASAALAQTPVQLWPLRVSTRLHCCSSVIAALVEHGQCPAW